MVTVRDLLMNVNPFKQTFLNYAEVFGIKLNNYFIGKPYVFSDSQKLHPELYNYFIRNKDFVQRFYDDWQKQHSMKDLAERSGQSVQDVIRLFNNHEVYMYRVYGDFQFKEDSVFRYFSPFQVVELLTGKQIIDRPHHPNSISQQTQFKN